MILQKGNVSLKDMSPQLVWGLTLTHEVWKEIPKVGTFPVDKMMVVTSINDSPHGLNSLHGKGRAADIRTKQLEKTQKDWFVKAVKNVLGKEWDVVFEDEGEENEHLHIEWDPK